MLLSYGEDLFLTRCSPDGTFDMITDNFNYPFLVLVVLVVTLGLRVLKNKVRSSKIGKGFM